MEAYLLKPIVTPACQNQLPTDAQADFTRQTLLTCDSVAPAISHETESFRLSIGSMVLPTNLDGIKNLYWSVILESCANFSKIC